VNREVRDVWVAALRSGRYAQLRGALAFVDPDVVDEAGDDHRASVGYCCLGVLCQLAVDAGVPVEVTTTPLGSRRYDGELNYLPAAVRRWADLSSPNPRVTVGLDDEWSLADLNDDGTSSFDDIAHLIEEQL
jgi:hypothetical protein